MSKKKMIGIIAVGVVVVIAIGAAWFLVSGKIKSFSSTSVTVASGDVCKTDIVNRYNAAMYYEPRDGATEATLDEAGLKVIVSDINSMTGYENDPTCQAMLFWTAIKNKDQTAATAAYEAVKSLHEKRIFADSNIRSNAAVFEYESALRDISPSESNKEGFRGDND